MRDAAGDAKQFTRSEGLLLPADVEDDAALEHDADLLVWMRMLLDHGVGFEMGHRQHHLLGRAGVDRHAGEDGVARLFLGSGEVSTHRGPTRPR